MKNIKLHEEVDKRINEVLYVLKKLESNHNCLTVEEFREFMDRVKILAELELIKLTFHDEDCRIQIQTLDNNY